MCGIAGFTWNNSELGHRMGSTLLHRGPDQSGVHAEDGVTLAHRRLSIIDLSEHGRQPLSNEDGSVRVVFSGEIYNHRDLRRDLLAHGHVFRSRADTEVLVHAYEQHGPSFVHRLNGMFAIALWDARSRELLLYRDRLGIKPLYYAVQNGGLAFASEIKALLEWPELDRGIDPQAIYDYMGFEFIPAPRTIFRTVRKLMPGHMLRFRDGREAVERYWNLELSPAERTLDEHAAVLRHEIDAAVRRELESDVPLGVFLSGGLDSSALVACMSRAGVRPIKTFSLGYADRSFSELEYARFVSKTFGTEHAELIIDPVTPEVIERAVWHLDEPMTDLSTVPFYLLCKKVREHVTVCLSGEGGDEIFVGYDRFKASKAHSYYSILPRLLREGLIGPAVRRLADRPQKKGAVNLLKRFIEGGMLPEDGGHMRWQFFGSPGSDRSMYQADFLRQIRPDPFGPIRERLASCAAADRLDREIYVDTVFTLPDSPLMKVDKMSMAHALEVRVPLLDHRLVELCATIPGRHKLNGFTTKAIFRRAMRGVLPERILNRGKQGYSLPIKNWLRGELRPFMLDTLHGSPLIRDVFNMRHVQRLLDEHQQRRANHNHTLWAMMNLALWHSLFGRTQPKQAGRVAQAAA